MARWASALGLAACLALTRARAGADTFTHKTTRQELKGKLLGSVSRDRKTLFMVRLDAGDARYLPEADWEVTLDKPKRPERPPWPKVTYNGKPRQAAWLGKQYEKFKDKIAIVEGNYYDTGGSHLWASEAGGLMPHRNTARYTPPVPWPKYLLTDVNKRRWPWLGGFALGDCARAWLKVLHILGPSEFIAGVGFVMFVDSEADPRTGKFKLGGSWTEGPRSQYVHVKGISTKGLVTGSSLACDPLVVVGTHTRWTTQRGGRTVFSCRPLPAERAPLTRAQFADALNGGFKLVEWKLVRKRKIWRAAMTSEGELRWHYGWRRVPVP